MSSTSLKKLIGFIYRTYKFKNYIVYTISNKKLKLKTILRRFVFFFKNIEINDKTIPWIPIKAKLWLDKILKPNMILYEFGSGTSTLYFATKVKKIISIEHDKNWYNNIKGKFIQEQINNCDYILIEPENITDKNSKTIDPKHTSDLKNYELFHFRKYIESINKYPDKHFDLIFIDGRVRIACIQNSIRKIKPGGYLVLDNSDEKKYKLTQKILKNYKKLDFFDIAPVNPYFKTSKISFWKTSIWQII